MAMQLTFLLLILSQKAMMIGTLTWTTETLSYTCCQSKNQPLMWNFTKGVNERILEFQWFFNETTVICLHSETMGFQVDTLYTDRVERNGTTGIIMKNVSLSDAGKYALYVKLAEEKIRNIQQISLMVLAQEPYQCKPIIEIHHQNGMYCSTTCLGSLGLSPEWIINGTEDPMGIGSYLAIHAGNEEPAFCCLHGFQCHEGDQFKFCIPNPIPSNILKDRIHRKEMSQIYMTKGIHNGGNDSTIITTLLVLMIHVVIMTTCVFLIIFIVVYTKWKRHKSRTKDKHVGDEDAVRGFSQFQHLCGEDSVHISFPRSVSIQHVYQSIHCYAA